LNYDGTLLFAGSHDRAFPDNVVTSVIAVWKAKAQVKNTSAAIKTGFAKVVNSQPESTSQTNDEPTKKEKSQVEQRKEARRQRLEPKATAKL